MEKINRQEKFAKRVGISLDNLESRIQPIKPSINKEPAYKIIKILNKEQRSLLKFYTEEGKNEGLTIQHLDPRQNNLNSVRFQMLKETGHLLKGIIIETYHCDLCDWTIDEPIAYFLTFGNNKVTISRDKLRRDDEKLIIGGSGTSKHMFDAHWDIAEKRLGKMGVKISRG